PGPSSALGDEAPYASADASPGTGTGLHDVDTIALAAPRALAASAVIVLLPGAGAGSQPGRRTGRQLLFGRRQVVFLEHGEPRLAHLREQWCGAGDPQHDPVEPVGDEPDGRADTRLCRRRQLLPAPSVPDRAGRRLSRLHAVQPSGRAWHRARLPADAVDHRRADLFCRALAVREPPL